MKIGIVTFVKTLTCNYGAELQAFALQYKLNSLGYDAEVVNLIRTKPSNSRFSETVKKAILTRFTKKNPIEAIYGICLLIKSVIKEKYYNKKYEFQNAEKKKMYAQFFEKKIKHSKKEYSCESIYTEELPYNIYIAGSDQIWNYNNCDRIDVFFLMFANKINTKRISYAASFSVSSIPDEYKEQYKKWINNIEYISVRENEGVKIVKELTGRDACHVCDPTLLLSKKDWENAFKNEGSIVINNKYVFIYTMSRSDTIFKIAKDIAKRLGNIDIIHVPLLYTPNTNDGITRLNNVSPPQWINLLKNAEYVMTDSFHATLFSINFNRPFSVIQNPMSNLNSRINTILSKFGLLNRIYLDNSKGELPDELLINYTKINNMIEEWKDDSLSFLLNALNR